MDYVEEVVVEQGAKEVNEMKSTDSEQYKTLQKKYSPATVCTFLNAFRKMGKFCDIKLKVDDVEYPTHKMILIGFSPFFNAMFKGDFSESSQSTVPLNVDGSVMEILLDYIYTGEIEITQANVQALLQAAHFLQAEALFQLCCFCLEEDTNINAENCLSLQNLVEIYSCFTLRDKAAKYSLENFAEVCKATEFLELNLKKLLELIGNDNLKVDKEDVVFDAVVRWMNVDPDERMEHFHEVLREVRLAHVDKHYLNDRVLAEGAIWKSALCMRVIEEANNYLLFKNRQVELQSSITRRRNNSRVVEVLLMFCALPGYKRDCTIALTEDGHCTILFPKGRGRVLTDDVPIQSFIVRNYNTQICDVVEPSDRRLNRLLVSYNRKDLSYNYVHPVANIQGRSHRFHSAWSELDGYWYAIGGLEPDNSISNTVDCYAPGANLSTTVSPLPEAVYGATAVSMGGLIYVLGGYVSHLTPCGEMQVYNPMYDSWTRGAPMPQLYEPSACALNSCIFVCSTLAKKKVNVFDASEEEWSRCADMNHEFFSGPVVLNARIFVITKSEDGERFLERYSPETDSWKLFGTFQELSPYNLQGPLLLERQLFRDQKCDMEILLL